MENFGASVVKPFVIHKMRNLLPYFLVVQRKGFPVLVLFRIECIEC